MIELKTLGSLQITGPAGHDYESVLAQPKRFTLLIYLALTERGGFARRDTILPLFWPELDAEHARGALRQSARFLRRALGDEVVLRRGSEELGVNAAALRCDAVAFEEAFEADELMRAADIYRGDFLRGLFVSNASPELEQWIENERARLRRRALQVLWKIVNISESE
jgi:DNA-binding SARP family transcriptional activator